MEMQNLCMLTTTYLMPAHAGRVDCAGDPVVARAADGVGIGAVVRECEAGGDVDEAGERAAARVVEVVLLAVELGGGRGQRRQPVRQALDVVVDLSVTHHVFVIARDELERVGGAIRIETCLDEVAPGGLGAPGNVAEVAESDEEVGAGGLYGVQDGCRVAVLAEVSGDAEGEG